VYKQKLEDGEKKINELDEIKKKYEELIAEINKK
jgi:hypothetical protein